MGYKQEKIFRWSNIIPTNERCDKERKRNSGIWNVQEQLNESHTTSTSKDSCQRTEPINYLRWSRNKPSSLPSKTAPVIDVEVYEQQEEPQVVWVNTKNTKKEASIVHVNLEDSDKNQRDDDVVFVEEVTTPPPNRPLEKSHAADLKKKVLSDILDETESYDNQNATSIKIKPMSKRKPIGDGKLAQDAASSRLPQKTRINVFDQINLDNELNAMQCNDMYQNAPKDHDPISVSSRDSSDSDVEVVPPKSTTTSSKKKDSDKDIKCMSRKWLLELDPNQQKNQENINDARPVSAIESNVNSTQNEARLSSAESIKEWLAKLDAKYFSTPVKTLEKLNDEHQDLSIVSKVNTEQNETLSYKPYTAGDRVLNLESKNNSGLLKSQEKPNDAPQESVSKLNTEQNEAQSIKLNNIREWVAGLKSTYVSTAQETQEDLSAVHKSNIVPKANSEQDGVYSFNLNTSKSPPLTAESEHEIDLQKSLKKLVDVRRESDIAKVKSEENEARSYLPSTSREWLSKLDAKYACIEHTMSQKNQGNLNDVRQKSALKVNSEQNEVRSLELNSTEEWLSELKSKCKYDFNKTHEKSNDSLRESTLLPKVISEQNEAWSYKPDNVEQRPSNLDCEHKTKKTAEKHQEVNSIDNTNRSFKFNTSEDLMVKLGSLYEKYQQETQGKNNNAHLKPDYTEQVSHQSQQNYELSNPKSIIVEIPADDDLPALTPDQGKLVDRALEPEPQEELLVEKFNIKIHRRDLQTLSDLNWLNDEVINFYMNLLMQRSEEREDLPKVYATNTFFYPKLMQSGQAGLRRWTRKVDIFAYDLFVVPVNVGSHWCICLVDFRAHIIKYLDSRGTPNQECLDALLQYLNDEHQDKKGAPFDASGWKTECLRDIPQQMNGSDCGMFACTFAEFSSRDAPYSFTQAQMPYLRRKAALEILMGKLLL